MTNLNNSEQSEENNNECEHCERKLKELNSAKKLVQSTIDSLSAHIAVLDHKGEIKYTNKAWRNFGLNNTPDSKKQELDMIGYNYIDVCKNATGFSSSGAKDAGEGIREVIQGESELFTMEYPCHSPEEKRWFLLRVTPYQGEGPYAAVVSHENITERKESELRLEKSLERGRQLHEQFLPREMPDIAGFEFAAHFEPAEKLGGDFYDFIEFGDRLVFFLSDVSGHDLSSAMLNIFLRENINSYFLSNWGMQGEISLSLLMDFVTERFIQEDFPPDFFICLILGVINYNKMTLKFINAGMQFYPLLLKKKQPPQPLKNSHMPISYLNTLREINYEEKCISLESDMTFLFFTDGLIEQKNEKGEMFGVERLKQLLICNNNIAPGKILARINNKFAEFIQEQPLQDDLTLLSLRYSKNSR